MTFYLVSCGVVTLLIVALCAELHGAWPEEFVEFFDEDEGFIAGMLFMALIVVALGPITLALLLLSVAIAIPGLLVWWLVHGVASWVAARHRATEVTGA